MDIEELIGQARDAVGVRRIYGEPLKRDGVTIIPAAAIRGGSGGGGGEGTNGPDGEATGEADEQDTAPTQRVGSGGGAGFGLSGRPVGAFVIKDGETTWKPVVDVTGLMQRALLLGCLTYVVTKVLTWEK